jgi:hypothetical protein
MRPNTAATSRGVVRPAQTRHTSFANTTVECCERRNLTSIELAARFCAHVPDSCSSLVRRLSTYEPFLLCPTNLTLSLVGENNGGLKNDH